MIDALAINPTQWVGLLAFALAGAACAHAARRQPQPWRALAWAQAAAFAEVLLGLRHRLHDAVDALLQAHGGYATRSTLQLALLACALIAVAIFALAVLRRHRDPDARRALAATCATAALFAAETVSLHRIDALMYTRVGPLLLIGLAWAVTCGIVTVCAWRAGRRA